jgi:D-serine deaminase-like pyridoxal phosphate-dependent protein
MVASTRCLPLLALLACEMKGGVAVIGSRADDARGEDSAAHDTDADTDADADADADTDADADADTDADADADTDADTDSTCTDEDLVLRALARDNAGTCALCAPGPITLVAVAQNLCEDGPLIFDTSGSCLVMQWRLTGSGSLTYTATCGSTATAHEIPASSSIEETHEITYLGTGDYMLAETFANDRNTTVISNFSVR